MKFFFVFLISLSFISSFAIDFNVSDFAIDISGNFEELQFSKLDQENESFTSLKMNECNPTGKIGDPELFVYSRLVNLPDLGNYKIEHINYEQEIIKLDHNLAPNGFSEENIKSSIYDNDQWLPSEIISISKPNIMGAYRFSQIAVFPLQYNPATDQIRIIKNIDIKLILDETIIDNPKIKQSPNMISSNLSNKIDNSGSITRSEQNGKYLFIVPDAFESVLDPLLRWKEKLGHKTRVATLSETGASADEIKYFIQNAYDNWELPPEYVVLVGDIDGNIAVPSFFVEGYYTPWDVSDHKYSLLEGEDYFPDVFVGRLSARTQLELNTIISKIINYESNPVIDDNWQKKAMMLSYIDEWYGYFSARETVMAVREKLLDFEYAEVDTFISPYQSGSNVITNMINNGYSFVNYRGAGGPSYWWGNYGPLFDIYGIESLSNGFKLPMVTSITCGGGDFANTSYPSCFGEVWLKAGSPSNPKGAIGFIGPSEIDTKTPFNNTNDMGIYQGITQEGITRCGEMMLRGKMELYNNYPSCHAWGNSNNSDQFYFYVYNLLGDPGLQVNTSAPKTFDVAVETEIPSNYNYIEAQAIIDEDDASGFTFAITNSDSLITVGYSNELGYAYIPIELNAGTYAITASKYGFIPVTTEFEVIDQDIIFLDSYTITDVIPNVPIMITADIANSTSSAASDIQVEIYSENEYVNILSGLSSISTLSAGASQQCEFEIELDPLWRDGETAEVFLEISSDLGEDTFYIPLQIISPQFTIAEMIIDEPNGNLLQNVISTFNLQCLNSGNYDSEATEIELVNMSTNFEVIVGNSNCNSVNTGEEVVTDTPFEIEVGTAISGELARFKFIITDGSDVLQEILYSYPIGEITEESPTFGDQGYIAIESSDEGAFTAPVYNWIEINPSLGGQGSAVTGGHVTGTDGFTKTLDLPFEFQYFGKIYDQISVCSNGWIAMGDTDLMFFRNKNIPSGVGPKAMIAPLWDNLINGSVYSYYDADDNVYIVEWYNARNYHSYSYETFQVVLYDPLHYPSINGDGDILFQYQEVNNNDQYDNYATIGIENETQTEGLLITFSNIYAPTAHPVEDETAILFTANGDCQVQANENIVNASPQLFQNYPNPFNPTTTISFTITSENSDDIKLAIYNVRGQEVKTYSDLQLNQSSINQVVWDGKDNNDQPVSSGVYFYKLLQQKRTLAAKKCLLLK